MRIKKRLLISLMLIGFFARAQQTPASKSQVETYLMNAHKDGLFNGNVLIVEGGKVLLRKSIGFADASKQVILTPEYRFHIGSIAKEFDAVAIMLLVEQGKLTLDDKLVKFFPTLPEWAKQISVRNLMQYTSGLPEINYQTVRSDADNWKDLMAISQLDFVPGSSYAYNNNNTFMRRQLVEKISGMRFKDFVEQRMLKKAGLKEGIVDPTDADSLLAKSFNNNFKQDKLQAPISGWTCVNLDDLYKWSASINAFTLISPESTNFILTPVGPDRQAGLGRGTMDNNRVLTHIHDGAALRYQALLMVDNARGRTIILLTNQKHDNIYDLGNGIKAILDKL
ncbi:beta-lactamase family protein [Spirosoma sp. KCTC 42546]|uniref:serine hydrolase domain-containing protein n=1 Tax=Spirosoma sp. KCTC 42546 TaxID=2520506 RepID=UPI001159D1C9|nr:serine hydrolase domain-containing protein [Spirosoma sp. KCTC 42546]QDK78868.1 beta-lactamase family protein [Spirosoma sp. KCTC 42546]